MHLEPTTYYWEARLAERSRATFSRSNLVDGTWAQTLVEGTIFVQQSYKGLQFKSQLHWYGEEVPRVNSSGFIFCMVSNSVNDYLV